MAKEDSVKELPQKRWAVGQIPTATKEVLVDTSTQQPLVVEESLALILNELEEMKETLSKILKNLN